jgi:hypothetical protein
MVAEVRPSNREGLRTASGGSELSSFYVEVGPAEIVESYHAAHLWRGFSQCGFQRSARALETPSPEKTWTQGRAGALRYFSSGTSKYINSCP